MVPLPEAMKMVTRGTICDAKTIAGVLWLASSARLAPEPR